MIAILFLLVFIAMAALAPWFGSDSRGLSPRDRADSYPARPADASALKHLH